MSANKDDEFKDSSLDPESKDNDTCLTDSELEEAKKKVKENNLLAGVPLSTLFPILKFCMKPKDT